MSRFTSTREINLSHDSVFFPYPLKKVPHTDQKYILPTGRISFAKQIFFTSHKDDFMSGTFHLVSFFIKHSHYIFDVSLSLSSSWQSSPTAFNERQKIINIPTVIYDRAIIKSSWGKVFFHSKKNSIKNIEGTFIFFISWMKYLNLLLLLLFCIILIKYFSRSAAFRSNEKEWDSCVDASAVATLRLPPSIQPTNPVRGPVDYISEARCLSSSVQS